MVGASAAIATTTQLALTLTSFRLIWNVPSQACQKDFGIALPLSPYGIEENVGQEFVGETIALFYNLGEFPRLIKEANGSYTSVNGGIPQLANLSAHLESILHDLSSSLPENFSGLGVVDFESWRAAFEQNFDALDIYRDVSRAKVRREHPTWSGTQVDNEAVIEFNAAARLFLSETLRTVQNSRPASRWGVYHYPYCFATTLGQSVCTNTAITGNDQLGWLFSDSQVLLPSLYMGLAGSTFVDRAKHIYANIQETLRVNKMKRPFFPYMNLQYEDGGFLAKEDLINTMGLTYDYGGAGVIMWGSSADVDSPEKCKALKTYLTDVLGPVAEDFHKRLHRCGEVFCGPAYRCQPRLRQRNRKQTFISRLDRLSALSYLITANPALGRQIFRKEFRCVPWR